MLRVFCHIGQIVVISGILALLATIAASYTVQPVKAQGKSDSAYDQRVIKPNAQCGQTNSCDKGAANIGTKGKNSLRDRSAAILLALREFTLTTSLFFIISQRGHSSIIGQE